MAIIRTIEIKNGSRGPTRLRRRNRLVEKETLRNSCGHWSCKT